mgnify:CR=1 FL=1
MPTNSEFTLRPGHPDFLDLPWNENLSDWPKHTNRLEIVDRGASRHEVVFVNYDRVIYAIKELPPKLAEHEYTQLRHLEEMDLPCVKAVGYVDNPHLKTSAVITEYLKGSLPYASLFSRSGIREYQSSLQDALAGLLVQIHLAGVFWGDCSLNNALFRPDAGLLQAYLVDAETMEINETISPTMRAHDLQILEENVAGGLMDLEAGGLLPSYVSYVDAVQAINLRYHQLWEEITRTETFGATEHYRIEQRISKLNDLGFSIGEVKLTPSDDGDKLNLKVIVTDRHYHTKKLFALTGLEAEEQQARQLVNEIMQIQANLAKERRIDVPANSAAFSWLDNLFFPIKERLKPYVTENSNTVELYCQVLDHKWYLSEEANCDVGHYAALDDYIETQLEVQE